MSVFSKVYEKMSEEIEKHEEVLNLTTEHFLSCLFYSTVISSFSYEGDIPEFIRQLPSYIEECFFMSSKVAYFEENGEPFITPCYPNGTLLDNGMYSHYTCIFRNGRTIIKSIEDVEICDNNSLGVPSRILVDEILQKCIYALRAVDMSLERASHPSLTFADDPTASLIVNAINESIKLRKPYALIKASAFKGDTIHKYDLFDNRAQDILALWDVFVRYKNLFFSSWGINNVEISKSERLTRAEGESNTEMIRYTMFYDLYEHRIDWFNRIKNHFNKTINVIVNRNVDTVTEFSLDQDEKIELKKMLIAPYASAMNPENNSDNTDETKEDENDKGE